MFWVTCVVTYERVELKPTNPAKAIKTSPATITKAQSFLFGLAFSATGDMEVDSETTSAIMGVHPQEAGRTRQIFGSDGLQRAIGVHFGEHVIKTRVNTAGVV